MAISDWADMMPATVQVAARTSIDGGGKPTYGTDVDYGARVEMRSIRFRDAQGREITGRGIVYLATTTVFATTARMTLPASYSPRVPVLLEVRPVEDEVGIHHVEAILG